MNYKLTRSPHFLEGVVPASSAPIRAPEVLPGMLKPVAWAKSYDPAALLSAEPISASHSHTPAPPSVTIDATTPPNTHEMIGAEFDPLPPTVTPPPAPLKMKASAPEPVAALQPRVEAAIATLRLQGERLAEQVRSDSLEIGLLVARRILEREVSIHLDAFFALIKSAIRRAGDARVTVVRVSPSDYARIQDAPAASLTLGRVEIREDDQLSVGDVMVDTDHHTIDGRMSTRLDEMARTLTEDD